MRIGDLGKPVVASKADWLPGVTYLGFTPRENTPKARAQLESTIQKQSAGGYVLEYVTANFGEPNPGFESDPLYLEERERHAERAGCLVAVHRIRHAHRPLVEIVGRDEFDRLQGTWAQPGKPYRWSVAFPIVESWEIDGIPRAREVFGASAYLRLYGHSSGVLRPLLPAEQQALDHLHLTKREAPGEWIEIEDEIRMAELTHIDPRLQKRIDQDLGAAAFEGESESRRAQLRKRAAWQANRFAQRRAKAGTLTCDHCGFDPASLLESTRFNLRSALDVHHTRPLEEGPRYTRIEDFALLCPTCHRVEHLMLGKRLSLLSG